MLTQDLKEFILLRIVFEKSTFPGAPEIFPLYGQILNENLRNLGPTSISNSVIIQKLVVISEKLLVIKAKLFAINAYQTETGCYQREIACYQSETVCYQRLSNRNWMLSKRNCLLSTVIKQKLVVAKLLVIKPFNRLHKFSFLDNKQFLSDNNQFLFDNKQFPIY